MTCIVPDEAGIKKLAKAAVKEKDPESEQDPRSHPVLLTRHATKEELVHILAPLT